MTAMKIDLQSQTLKKDSREDDAKITIMPHIKTIN